MNDLSINILKFLRKIYGFFINNNQSEPKSILDPNLASEKIFNILVSDKPCMIARFGSTELTCLVNYIGVSNSQKSYFSFISGKTPAWWWESSILTQMQQWSGFFPPTEEMIEQFCKVMLNDISQVDILGSWLSEESIFEEELKDIPKIRLGLLDPYWSSEPWTKALEGKKVLVVHPFTKTIESQYEKRKLLFKSNILPMFELRTVKAVQSIAGTKTEYKNWFDALDYMKNEIDKVDYDICLIGAGAYGFPLAAHVKRKGKKAVHIGGSLQLLFGIRGKRWEDENYHKIYNYASLMNQYWVKPNENEKPSNSDSVEDNCYW